jgi:uncharacterized protein (DUF2062 family)
MRRLRYILYKLLRRFVRLHDSPHSIATGASIGMFIGMIPIYGFQIITAAAVATVARVNKVAAILPVWITNPLTIAPILYLQYLLGRLLVRGKDVEGVWPKIREVGRAAGRLSFLDWKRTSYQVLVAARALGWEALWPTLIGSLISGLALGLLTYPLTLRAVFWYRRRKEARRARRRERLAAYLEAKAREEAAAENQPGPESVAPPGP